MPGLLDYRRRREQDDAEDSRPAGLLGGDQKSGSLLALGPVDIYGNMRGSQDALVEQVKEKLRKDHPEGFDDEMLAEAISAAVARNAEYGSFTAKQGTPTGMMDVGGVGGRVGIGPGELSGGVEAQNLRYLDPITHQDRDRLTSILKAGYSADVGPGRVAANVMKPTGTQGVYMADMMGSMPVGGGVANLGFGGSRIGGKNNLDAIMGGYNTQVGPGNMSLGVNRIKGRGNQFNVGYNFPFR